MRFLISKKKIKEKSKTTSLIKIKNLKKNGYDKLINKY